MGGQRKAFSWFVGCSVAGGALSLTAAGHGWQQARAHPLVALILAGLLLVTELMPVTLLHRRGEVEVATSTTFLLAMLLFTGIGPALVTQLVASLVADIVHRKAPVKIAFNMAQFALGIVAGGSVLAALGGHPTLHDGLLRPAQIGPAVAAILVYLVVNNCMVWAVVSLATGNNVWHSVVDHWQFNVASSLVLVGLAPVVDLVAIKALPMLPLLLIPVGAIYVTARSSVALAHQALHDGLTGLANRTAFQAEVRASLEETGRMRHPLAVLLVDLDRFKEINDTLGHHIGDVLLREVGPRLAAASEKVSFVARLGGDEFAVLLTDIEGPQQAVEVGYELNRALEQPFILSDGLVLEVEGSIGVVVTPEHGGDVDVLLQRADVAMYLAKDSKSGVELYSPERDDNSRRRLTLIGQLRAAIANDELTLFYQPKLNVVTQEFSGVEALVRWIHPTLGTLSPDEFIPLAERSGLIKPLTSFVLKAAIAQATRWHRDGFPLRMAVNLSARTILDYQLPSTVAALLADAGMEPRWLELEITETELMADPLRGAKVLNRLHAMGVWLTIDDFGTGYSSLAYLSSLPVDEIKIDRCFVEAMAGDDSADDIIVRSTIEMARNLSLEVTAEGVETADQVQRLKALGCNFLQGFYFSRPVPADQLFTLLAATSALSTRRSHHDGPG